MEKDSAIRVLRDHRDEIRAFGANALYIFGSVSRDEAGPASDVDLFVDYDPESGFSLIELLALKTYLSALLSADADVTTRDSLHPVTRRRILSDAERVF